MRRTSQSSIPFRFFDSSFEVSLLVVMVSVRFQRSVRNVDDPLFNGGVDTCRESVAVVVEPVRAAVFVSGLTARGWVC